MEEEIEVGLVCEDCGDGRGLQMVMVDGLRGR